MAIDWNKVARAAQGDTSMYVNQTAGPTKTKAQQQQQKSTKPETKSLPTKGSVMKSTTATADANKRKDVQNRATSVIAEVLKTSSGAQFAKGFGRGAFSMFDGSNPNEKYGTETKNALENSTAYKAGEIGGTLASFAVPYAGATKLVSGTKAVAKGADALTRLGMKAPTAQKVATSVGTDLAVGLPLNLNYAVNVEGQDTAGGIAKSVAKNTAIDLALGAGMEGLGAVFRHIKGKRVGNKVIESAEDVADLSKQEFDELVAKVKAEGGSEEDLRKLADFVNERRGKNAQAGEAINAYSTNEFANAYGLPVPSRIINASSPRLRRMDSESVEEAKSRLGTLFTDEAARDLDEAYDTVRVVWGKNDDYWTNAEVDRLMNPSSKINQHYDIGIEEKIRAVDNAIAKDKNISIREKMRMLDETGIGYEIFGDDFAEMLHWVGVDNYAVRGVTPKNLLEGRPQKYERMSNAEIEEARRRLGIKVGHNEPPNNPNRGFLEQSGNIARQADETALKSANDIGADGNRILATDAENAEKYGAFPKSGTAKASAFGDYTKGVDTILADAPLEDATKEAIIEAKTVGDFTKFTRTNATDVSNANNLIDTLGVDGAYKEFMSKSGNGMVNSKTIALGARLIQELEKAGDSRLMDTIDVYLDMLSETGRTLQASKILSRLTPEGRLASIRRTANNLSVKYGEGQKIELSDETVNAILSARTEAEIQKAHKRAAIEMWNNIPAGLMEKIDAFRYISMLMNPKTHLRNIIGNIMFVVPNSIKNVLQTGLEGAILRGSLKDVERKSAILTKTDDDLIEFAKKQFDEIDIETYKQTGKMNENVRPTESKVYDTKFMEFVRTLNSDALDKEDTIFGKMHYAKAFARYMKANNLTLDKMTDEALNRAREIALETAWKNTFRDANALSSAISRLSYKLANGGAASKVGHTILEGLLPFKKTPINIARRGIDFSPIGLARGIFNTVRGMKHAKSGEEVETLLRGIEDIAGGTAGTGIFLIGALLGGNDFVSGNIGVNKEANYNKMDGEQNYSVRIGDNTYTIDWAQPIAIPFFVGAELGRLMSEDGLEFADVVDSSLAIIDPLLELSMLSGLNEAISGNYTAGGMVDAVEKSVASYIGQYVPTMLGQVNRTFFDDTRRSTTSTDESTQLRFAERNARKMANKIPGLSKKNEPYINLWGEEEKNGSDNLAIRAFEQFVSPGYIGRKNDSAVDAEIRRLANALPDDERGVIFPAFSNNYEFSYGGNDYRMSEKDLTQYKKTSGKAKFDGLDSLFKMDSYKKASDQDKAQMIKKVYENASEEAKLDFLAKKVGNKAYLVTDEMAEAYENSPENYSEKDIYKQYRNAQTALSAYGANMQSSAGLKAIAFTDAGIPEDLFQYFGAKVKKSKVGNIEDVASAASEAGIDTNDVIETYDALDGDSTKAGLVGYLNSTGYTEEQKYYLFALKMPTAINPYRKP